MATTRHRFADHGIRIGTAASARYLSAIRETTGSHHEEFNQRRKPQDKRNLAEAHECELDSADAKYRESLHQPGCKGWSKTQENQVNGDSYGGLGDNLTKSRARGSNSTEEADLNPAGSRIVINAIRETTRHGWIRINGIELACSDYCSALESFMILPLREWRRYAIPSQIPAAATMVPQIMIVGRMPICSAEKPISGDPIGVPPIKIKR
jgi:hypothetical protein